MSSIIRATTIFYSVHRCCPGEGELGSQEEASQWGGNGRMEAIKKQAGKSSSEHCNCPNVDKSEQRPFGVDNLSAVGWLHRASQRMG